MRSSPNPPLWLCILILLALAVPSHAVGIARFSDIDEPFWITNGSNFYYALTHRDFKNTVYEYHPGVTTTWVVAAGMLTTFPEYRGFGQGYFDPYKWKFEEFMRSKGQDPLVLVRISRLFQTAVLLLFAVILFLLLQLLVDRVLALAAVLLAFNAPFYLGHSRLLNNEGMLAIFVTVSVLAMLVYLQRGRRLRYLLLSGICFGLAQLTKSPSILVVGVVGLMLLVDLISRRGERTPGSRLLETVKGLALWLGSAGLVYVLLWPGMWVDPTRMLYEVYGNAFSYAFQGARLDVTGDLQPAAFSLNTALSGELTHLIRLALRSTPLTWMGFLLAVAALFFAPLERPSRSLVVWLGLTAALFILLFGLAQGRDSPHYILTSFFCLDLIAGLGWGFGLTWLLRRWKPLHSGAVRLVGLGLLVLAQIAAGLPYFPYYYTYPNPLLARTSANVAPGYGEGLDLAAHYLAAKQDAKGLRAFVYNGMGTFSYFFPGRVEVLKRQYFLPEDMSGVIQGMRWSEYLVVYTAAMQNLPEAAPFLNALESVQPEKIFMLYGREYVRVYRSADIPNPVYKELEK